MQREFSRRAHVLRRALCVAVITAVILVAVPGSAFASGGWALFFDEKTPSPSPLRGRAATAVTTGLAPGCYYLGGDSTTNFTGLSTAVDVYDPANDVWTPAPPLVNPVVNPNAVTVGTYVILMGGRTGSSNPVFDIVKYDTATGAQTVIGTLNAPVYGSMRAVVNMNGPSIDIYIVGGGSPSIRWVKIDPAVSLAIEQTPVATLPGSPPLNNPMVWWDDVAGMLHIAGGDIGGVLQTAHYQMAYPSFLLTAGIPLNTPRGGPTGAQLVDGRWYFAVGKPFSDASAVNAASSWAVVGSLPTPRYAASNLGWNNKLVVVGGRTFNASLETTLNEVGTMTWCNEVLELTLPASTNTLFNVGQSSAMVNLPVAGNVVVSEIDPAWAGQHGFQVGGVTYDISTNADYTGQLIEITLPCKSPAPPAVHHWVNGTLQHITTTALPDGSKIVGYNNYIGQLSYPSSWLPSQHHSVTILTATLSPFGVEEAAAPPVVSTPASSDWSLVLGGLFGLFLVLVALRRQWRAA